MLPRIQKALFLIATVLAVAASAHAQAIPTGQGGLDLTASSDNPIPGQVVTITAKSYSTDINSAKITWSVNGKAVQSGIGVTSLDVNAPPLGSKLNVVVSAVTNNGAPFSNSIVIGSGSVDMILENDGYVPPLFLGKISASYQNSVKVIAVPHIADSSGVEYDPKTLVYQWKKNNVAIENGSGYGKQSIVIPGDIIPRAYTISVTAAPRSNAAQAFGIISVDPQSPSIKFYRSDALYGPLFNQAITDTVRLGTQKETSILAVPFGFNKPIGNVGSLSLSWLINGIEHPELASYESIVIRAPEGSGGSSNIELNVKNTKQILQGAQAGFSAQFNSGTESDASSSN